MLHLPSPWRRRSRRARRSSQVDVLVAEAGRDHAHRDGGLAAEGGALLGVSDGVRAPLAGLDRRGPLGPALVFRGFPGKTLEAFVKEHRGSDGRSDLTIDDKLTILRRVADALAVCHRNDAVHGALSPEAVLVHRAPDRGLEVKLTRFALAAAGDPGSDGTRLFTRLAGASANLYEAPEVARGASATAASDLFSLGALAYYLLAEQAPASTSVELAARLERDGGLIISAVRDDLFPAGARESLDLVLKSATALDPTARTQDLGTLLSFVELLEDALTTPAEGAPDQGPLSSTQPAQPAPELEPLAAVKDSVLGGDLVVLGELGSGATARVFKVRHPVEGEVALKVPLSDAHDDRIAREGEVLERLRRIPGVDRIAHFIGMRQIAGHTCLLVQFAGERTLADEIRAEGALSLDYARRWGDDLLTALRSLEEAGVQHRDIKPANIGLTSGNEKGKKRLLLFDFSLSQRPATDLAIGTPAYKDPELGARGRWDDAADRWAAAITLHEMFTGVRPAPLLGMASRPGSTAVRLDPDRFDAGVRDGLVRFFERALRAVARERFSTADDMRDAFIKALHNVPEHEDRGADEPVIEGAGLQGKGPDASVGELPLSTRQQNALDRMGIYTLHDLAQLSSNRLGGVRGVGAKTARSLVAGGGRPLGRGAPDAEHAARTVARRMGGELRWVDALLLDAAEAVANEKKLRGGLAPAIAADDLGPDGPAWPRLLDLMRLAAQRGVAEILAAPGLLVLTRLGLLARYDLLSFVAELASAHRVPAPEGGPGRAATWVVLPVYAGEGAVVEVAANIAPRVGASAGTLLVPVPGVLPHEIIEVPGAWMERYAERREVGISGYPAP